MFICSDEDAATSSLNSNPLKLVNQFIYFCSNISFMENSVRIGINKAWIAIARLTTKWKSCLSNKNKTTILSRYSCVITLV